MLSSVGLVGLVPSSGTEKRPALIGKALENAVCQFGLVCMQHTSDILAPMLTMSTSFMETVTFVKAFLGI